MSVTVYFANVSKRRNSTYQGTFTTNYDCVLKDATSLDRPTFLVSAATMDYNTAKWGDRYYFIDDVVSVRNNQWEVSCVLDVLATYKADILASTQYVCYSASQSIKTWLADTRIPILNSCSIHQAGGQPAIFNYLNGYYCLTVSGKNGCDCYALTKSQITQLIDKINQWAIDDYDKIMGGTFDPNNPITYSWATTEDALQSLSMIMTQSGAIGNAYSNAPQMIRSCAWVPLNPSYVTTAGNVRIYLGDYDTGIDAPLVKSEPYTNTFTYNIPWQYNDWRRKVCESVQIVMPYCGAVSLPSDQLTGVSQLEFHMSISGIDGGVAFAVVAGGGGPIIGYYGGSCASEYAIGINQRSGLAEIVETMISGVEKTVAVAVDSSVSPVSIAGAAVGATLEGINTVYQTQNTAISTLPTTIGNIGGSSAAGLPYAIEVNVFTHTPVTTQSAIAATMGVPVMAPTALSGLTGYCQCANAHIAVAAQAREIDAIDMYMNSGFFIE